MCDFYEVKIWGAGCVVLQEKFEHAIDLCRLRLGTTLQENNIKVIKGHTLDSYMQSHPEERRYYTRNDYETVTKEGLRIARDADFC